MKLPQSKIRRAVSGLLAGGLLATTLGGCSGNLYNTLAEYMPTVEVGQTISEDSKWINSSIVGALNDTVQVNLKDDFYTAVNRDELLATETENSVTSFDNCMALVSERLLDMIMGVENPDADLSNEYPTLSTSQTAHDVELVQALAAIAGDDARREAEGAEPARRYLDAVANISTLDELTAYLLNEGDSNIALNYLIPFVQEAPSEDNASYRVLLTAAPALSLQDARAYFILDPASTEDKSLLAAQNHYLLERLGWEADEVERLLNNCYKLEEKLADSIYGVYVNDEPLRKIGDNSYTYAELAELQGSYPLTEILAAYGLGEQTTYRMEQPQYVAAVCKLYNEDNLEQLKAYFLVHTVPTLLPLLDSESRAMVSGAVSLENVLRPTVESDAGDELTPEQLKAQQLIDTYITNYLSVPLQQAYVAYYCTQEDKDALNAMVDEIMEVYHPLLEEQDWLSEETKAAALEKLDNMAARVLFPDTFTDYTPLVFSADNTLPEAVAAINSFEKRASLQAVGQPVDRGAWNMAQLPTIVTNAVYMPTDNSITIFAGITATEDFSAESNYEETLGRIGAIVGHEISHAFDSNGSQYDKNGNQANWWTFEDSTSFNQRVTRLAKAFSATNVAPGYCPNDYGTLVQTEAIADMGGVKSTLMVAAKHPGFDYDAYFTAYAKLWFAKYTYSNLFLLTSSDVHPLTFLRTNMVLQQFDEFLETYDIQPGDGMYLAQEDRINVW